MILSYLNFEKRLVLIPVFFFVIQNFFNAPEATKRTDYVAPPVVIKNLTAGLNTQLSDSFWIRALQDFDFCDEKKNTNVCRGNSWLFKVIDLTTDLDSKFTEAFFYGGLALTVLITDVEGASKIFDKGTDLYPRDWQLNYVAGYHSMIEEKDYVKAAKRFSAAANNGAPNWVHVLAGRMAVQGGDTGFAEQILEQMISMSQDTKLIERLKTKLAETRK